MRLLIICFVFVANISSAQKLDQQAVYYDADGVPYKIEKRYLAKDVETYILHGNQNSYCIKQQTFFTGDTTIVRKETFRILYEKTKIDLFQQIDYWSTASIIDSDTIRLRGYAEGANSESSVLLMDTFATGRSAEDYRGFIDQLKKGRVSSILNGKMTVKEDSMKLNETRLAYFVKGILVKVEQFDANNNMHTTEISAFSKNKIIYSSHFKNDSVKPYKIETVSWNNNTTKLKWSTTRFDEHETYYTKFKINKDLLSYKSKGSNRVQIQFMSIQSVFKNILINNIFNDDVLVHSDLLSFQREKILLEKYKEGSLKNKYTFDGKKNIVEQVSFYNGQFQYRVIYQYY